MGAITTTLDHYITHGAKRERACTITLSSSYGQGDTFTPRLFGLLAVQALRPTNPAAYKIVPNITTSQFKVYQELPTGITEVSSGVDLSGVSFKAEVIGY